MNKTLIKTVKGDITKITDAQAIVNAANSSLLGGCKTGQAKITKAYNLPCDYIIHTVGPVWNGGEKDEATLLANCYYNSMTLAVEKGIRTIAFPSISTGIFHFPVQLAARIAVGTVARFVEENAGKIDMIEWVLFDDNTYAVYEAEVDKYYQVME